MKRDTIKAVGAVGIILIACAIIMGFAYQWFLVRMWQSKMLGVTAQIAMIDARNDYEDGIAKAFAFRGNASEQPTFTGEVDSGVEIWEPFYYPMWFFIGENYPDRFYARAYSKYYNTEMRKLLLKEDPERELPGILRK